MQESASQLPKLETGGGVTQFGKCPYLSTFSNLMASVSDEIKEFQENGVKSKPIRCSFDTQ